MDQSALERRIRALEQKSAPFKGASAGADQPITDDIVTVLEELEGLAREIRLIREGALVAGDDRLVLACAREFCRVAELSARLRGEIEEKTTNVYRSISMRRQPNGWLEPIWREGKSWNLMNDHLEILRLVRDDLACYAIAMWPGFELAAHHRVIVDRLEAVERGEIRAT